MRRFKGLAWSLALLGIGLLGGELACRAALALHGEPFDASRQAQTLRGLQHELEQLGSTPAARAPGSRHEWLIHPYLGFESAASSREFEQALSASRPTSGDARAAFRVLLLGGAAARLDAASEQALRAKLGADPRLAGREIVLLQGAASVHKQPQHALRLELLLERGLQVEAVVELDGFNELALASENHAHGIDPLLPWGGAWSAMLEDSRLERGELDVWIELRDEQAAGRRWLALFERCTPRASALGGSLARNRLERALERARALVMEGRALRANSPANAALLAGGGRPSEDAALRIGVRCWAESALTMQALCEARGILFLHALEPLQQALAALDEAAEPRARLHAAALRKGLPSLRAGGEWLRAQQVAHVDLSQLLPAGRAEDATQQAREATLLAESLARELLVRLPPR